MVEIDGLRLKSASVQGHSFVFNRAGDTARARALLECNFSLDLESSVNLQFLLQGSAQPRHVIVIFHGFVTSFD